MGLISTMADTYQRHRAKISARRKDRYMRDQVVSDIQRFISKNCPRISMGPGHQRRLTQAIEDSLAYVSGGIERIPGPVDLTPREWENQPALHAMFVDAEQIRSLLQTTTGLKRVFETTGAPAAMALLAAEIHEKTVFGIEQTGDIMRRDVPRKALYFQEHQLLAPTGTLEAFQVRLKRLALVLLCRQTLRETKDLAAWKKELEDMQQLLEFKLETRETADQPAENDEDLQKTLQVLSEIKIKIKTLTRQTEFTPEHLDRIIQVFESPEQHLTLKTKDIKLNRLGVWLDAASTEQADVFSIAEIQYEQMPKMAAIWVRINREALAFASKAPAGDSGQ